VNGLFPIICAITLSACAVITDADEADRKDADDDGVHWLDDCDDEDPDLGDPLVWYKDADGDTFGGPVSMLHCVRPVEGVRVGGDCDDGDTGIHPDAAERCNGVDDDCDGEVDEGCEDTGGGE
jgi:hypothetical protein